MITEWLTWTIKFKSLILEYLLSSHFSVAFLPFLMNNQIMACPFKKAMRQIYFVLGFDIPQMTVFRLKSIKFHICKATTFYWTHVWPIMNSLFLSTLNEKKIFTWTFQFKFGVIYSKGTSFREYFAKMANLHHLMKSHYHILECVTKGRSRKASYHKISLSFTAFIFFLYHRIHCDYHCGDKSNFRILTKFYIQISLLTDFL